MNVLFLYVSVQLVYGFPLPWKVRVRHFGPGWKCGPQRELRQQYLKEHIKGRGYILKENKDIYT